MSRECIKSFVYHAQLCHRICNKRRVGAAICVSEVSATNERLIGLGSATHTAHLCCCRNAAVINQMLLKCWGSHTTAIWRVGTALRKENDLYVPCLPENVGLL